jgi:hypothetical protein
MDEIERHTCIRFVPRTIEENYVSITDIGGWCNSHVGNQNHGPQAFFLRVGDGIGGNQKQKF